MWRPRTSAPSAEIRPVMSPIPAGLTCLDLQPAPPAFLGQAPTRTAKSKFCFRQTVRFAIPEIARHLTPQVMGRKSDGRRALLTEPDCKAATGLARFFNIPAAWLLWECNFLRK